MTENDLKLIQKRIGYTFKNIHLLQQAFIRESYVLQDKEHQSNETLIWIGKELLSILLKEKIVSQNTKINDLKEFSFITSSDYCNQIYEKFVSEAFLAQRIEIFGLNQFLVMGQNDKRRKAQKMFSAKSELLKAIIGAVAIDSNYNMFSLKAVVELLIDVDYYLITGFDSGENYLLLMQKWATIGGYSLPRYEFNSNSFSYGSNFFQCTCFVEQINRTFSAKGINRSDARMKSAHMAYDYLKQNNLLFTIRDEIKNPKLSLAVNQLQELSMKGYFPMPLYSYEEVKDKEHDQIWNVKCEIPNQNIFHVATSLTKKEAKKEAAYQVLLKILNQF